MEIELVLSKCANFGMVPGREPCIKNPEEVVRIELPLSEEQARLIFQYMRQLANATRFEHCHLNLTLTVGGVPTFCVSGEITNRAAKNLIKNSKTISPQ